MARSPHKRERHWRGPARLGPPSRNQLANIGRAHTITQTIGQALDARAKMASDTIGQALNTWDQGPRAQLASIGRATYTTDVIGQALRAWDQGVRDQLSDLVPADVQADAVGQTFPGLERPPAAQIAIRSLVLTVFVLLIAAFWEQTKERPAEAIKGVLELVAMWYALDLWIWRKLS
jgi:hypothetical protein